MQGYISTLSDLSFAGVTGYYFGGLTHSLPLPVMVLALAVVAIAMHGAYSRMQTLKQGENAGTDLIGIMVVLVMFVLVSFLLTSGIVKTIQIL